MVGTARELEDALVGELIQARYRVLRLLARGGMGAVYEAEHVRLGKRVAIKTLLRSAADRPDAYLRFEREARAASAIGHPGIVDVTDLGELADGTPYMALELLEGRDWQAAIDAEGPQPIGPTVRRLRAVCEALGAAHAAGIVHRDLKPANVFLVDGGETIKLLDFGVARFRPDGVEAALTRTGTAIGTARYMSPEQAKGLDVDHRTDLWALGVLLFHALTGSYPFDDASLPMLVVKLCTEEPPSLAEHRRDVPPALDAIVRKLLARAPEDRFASCAELASDLAPFARHEGPPDVRGDAPDRRDAAPVVLSGERRRVDPPRSRALPYVAVILGLALAAGIAFWAASRDEARARAPVPTMPRVAAAEPAPPPDPVEPPPVAAVEPSTVTPAPPTPARRRVRTEPEPTPTAAPERPFRTTAVSAEEF